MLKGSLRHTVLSLLAKIVAAGAAYVLAYVLGRTGGAEVYGRFELVLTCFWIGALLGRMGLDGAWVRHLPTWRSEGSGAGIKRAWRQTVVRVAGVSLLTGAAMAWIRIPLAEAFGNPNFSDDLQWAWVAIPAMALVGLVAEALRGAEAFVGYAMLQRGTFLLITACAVVAWGADPVWAFSAATFLGMLIAIPWGGRALTRGLNASKGDGGALFQRLRQTAWPMILGAAAFELMSWSDTLMCGVFLEEDAVGRYRLAFRLAALLTLGQTALNSALAPKMARASATEIRGLIQWSYRWNVLIALAGGAVLLLAGPMLISIFGHEFASDEAVLVLRVLALGTAFNALSGPVLTLMNMTGSERQARDIIVGAAAINIGLNAWLIPSHGIAGAAWATSITTVLWNAWAAVWVARKHGVWTWFPFSTTTQHDE